MATFYDEWLNYWDDAQEQRDKARKIIQPEEQEWVRTKQDYRAALLCSRQNGFFTSGEVMLGEIPRNWSTGKHSHGEEGIYIIEGQGFSVVDDKRYDWDTGSCLFMPFGSIHQHFNTGDAPVHYLSAMALGLERFAGLAKVIQYEDAGECPMNKREAFETAESDIHPEYGRIVLKSKDAVPLGGKDSARRLAERGDEYGASVAKQMKTEAHRSRMIHLMDPQNGFKAREVNITSVLIDAPHKNSGRHGHMEALLYVLQGEGHSLVGDGTVDWRKGSLMQVQGPLTVHQHFNTGDVEAHHLRIHFGIRSHFFQPITKRVFSYEYYELSPYGD